MSDDAEYLKLEYPFPPNYTAEAIREACERWNRNCSEAEKIAYRAPRTLIVPTPTETFPHMEDSKLSISIRAMQDPATGDLHCIGFNHILKK